MITLIDILRGERHIATTPVGLETLKASWRFSTDFPVAVDRGISSENLKFYKGDRAWLLAIFEDYGTSAVVDMEFESNNLTFSVVLDFTTASYDDVFFEVGYKFSRLADQIKELDEVGKIDVETTERVEYQLNNKIQSVTEQKDVAKLDKMQFSIAKTTIAGQKKLVTILGAVNTIGLPAIQGVEVGSPISSQHIFHHNNPIAPITVGTTTCEVLFVSDYYSHIGEPSPIDENICFSSLLWWKVPEGTDSYSLGHIEGRWNFHWVLDNNATSITSIAWFAVFAYYWKRGGTAMRYLGGTARSASGYDLDFTLNDNIAFPETLSLTYNGVTYEGVSACFVCIPYITADIATGLAYEQEVCLSDCVVSGVKITHSLTNINRNVFLLPVNRYFQKLGLFVNQCTRELENALLTSKDFMQRGGTLSVKPSDVMHDISLLYAVKFVEKAGKYVIMRLDQPTPEIEEITQFTDIHYTALPCYTGAKIAARNTNEQNTRYPEQIFTGTAAINDTRIAANILQLSTNLTTDGGQILQELIEGNGGGTYLFHADNVQTRQLAGSALGRQINEYYMFREVVARLLPFLASWVRPLQPLEITDCDSFYNNTTNTGATDTITPPAPPYHHALLSAKIPVNFAVVRAILSGCKRLKIGGLTITLKEIEINVEPSVAEISGFIENQ